MTRPADQAEALRAALARAGAVPLSYPTIAVEPPPSWELFDAGAARVHAHTPPGYDWVLFTSPSAVRFALDRSPDLARALAIGRARTAAVGAETARALHGRGITADLVPEDQRQEGLIESFRPHARDARILFPQAVGGRELLRAGLARMGAHVDTVPVSMTRSLPLGIGPPAFDVVVFASPSALRAFLIGRPPGALDGKAVVAIGPTTAEAARAAGVSVDVMPASPSVPQLIEALGRWWRQKHPPGPPRSP